MCFGAYKDRINPLATMNPVIAIQSACIPPYGSAIKYTGKNTIIVAISMEFLIGFVAVAPIKTPSQIKLTALINGAMISQMIMDKAVFITSRLFVKRYMISRSKK